MRKYSSNLAFVDMLFNLLVGFTSLFIIAFLLINPIAEQGKVDPVTQFMITFEWDKDSTTDIDAWVKGPDGKLLSYQAKDRRYMVLERDDLGMNNDMYVVNGETKVVRRNIETVTINDIVEGEYHITVHFFGPARADPSHVETVTVTIMDMHPFRIVLTKEIQVTLRGEGAVASFVVDEQGNITDLRDDVKFKLRPAGSYIQGATAG